MTRKRMKNLVVHIIVAVALIFIFIVSGSASYSISGNTYISTDRQIYTLGEPVNISIISGGFSSVNLEIISPSRKYKYESVSQGSVVFTPTQYGEYQAVLFDKENQTKITATSFSVEIFKPQPGQQSGEPKLVLENRTYNTTEMIHVGISDSSYLQKDVTGEFELWMQSNTTTSKYFGKIIFPIGVTIDKEGRYYIILKNATTGEEIDKKNILVGSDNAVPVPTTPANCSSFKIMSTKSNYVIGENVELTINTRKGIEPSPGELQIVIQTGEKKYKFLGQKGMQAAYLPSDPGIYTAKLMCFGQDISYTTFIVDKDNSTIQNVNKQSSEYILMNESAFINEDNGNTLRIAIRKMQTQSKKNPVLTTEANAPFEKDNVLINIPETKFTPKSDLKIYSVNYNELTTKELRIKKLRANISNFSGNAVDAFAVDLSNLNFTNGTLTRTAKGNELWKCAEWDYGLEQCNGTWKKIMDISPGEIYIIGLNSSDPGYAESLRVLNIQSYPTVGEVWRVDFDTIGTSNLTINTYNGTTWRNTPGNSDLLFSKLYCGGVEQNYTWVNNSVFVENYSCNSTSSEVSDVLTSGVHNIMFTFGNLTAFAHNYATASWWNSSYLYRQPIDLSVSSGATPKEYQMEITLNSSNVGANFNWTNECIGGNDSRIRFVNSTSTATLPFWVTSCSIAGQTMDVWVRVDKNITTLNYTMFMYYGDISGPLGSDEIGTFDYVDKGDNVGTWTTSGAAGQTNGNGLPSPSYDSRSNNGAYMYKDVNLTNDRIVEFNVYSTGLGNFYFLSNSAGNGQHFRAETRSGNNAGIGSAASWTSWSVPSQTCSNIATNTWYNFTLEIGSTTAQAYINGTACGGAYTFSNNGHYIGLVGDALGNSYRTYWDNIRVRKYFSSIPKASFAAEESPLNISFVNPTYSDAATPAGNSVPVNISISGPSPMQKFSFNWNGSNTTLYDDSLLMLLNLDNRSSLDENDSFVRDVSVYGNNGTVIAGATPTSNGKYDGGYAFDGSTGYINVSASSSLDSITNQLTASAWVYPIGWTLPNHNPVLWKGSQIGWGANYLFRMALNTGSTTWGVTCGGTEGYFAVGSVNLDEWSMLTITFDGTTTRAYINGTQVGTSTKCSGQNLNVMSGYPVRSGFAYRSTPSEQTHLNGTVDELMIWNRSLNATEIHALYRSTLQKITPTSWTFYTNVSGLSNGAYTYQGNANYGSGSVSTQSRSVSIGNAPPSISNVQCYKTGSGWISCPDSSFGDTINKVRAQCSSNTGEVIQNMTFALENTYHSLVLFNGTVTSTTGGYWEYDFSNTSLNYSGFYNLSTSCSDTQTSHINQNWTFPWGVLTGTLINPSSAANQKQNQTFTFTANLTCTIGECGNVNATLDPASWYSSFFGYRQEINLSVPSGTTQSGFQVEVRLNSSNVGNHFNWSNECVGGNSSRVRFVNGSDNAEIPFWVQNCSVLGQNMTVWVKSDKSLSTTPYTVYMYYDNLGGQVQSNGTETFDFFDDFSGDLSKWTVHQTSGVYPRIESGTLVAGGGTTSAPYGHTSVGSNATYSSFNDGIIEGDVYHSTNAIGEVSFRGNFASNTGYKSRMDARSGQGLSHLKPPYTGWGFLSGCSATGIAVTTGTWEPFKITVNGSTFTIQTEGQTKTCSDTQYTTPGEISLQNHYGSYTTYDNIRVRKYSTSTPSVQLGPETITNIKGVVPMNSGSPFYTSTQNPMDYTNNSCLADMISGDNCVTEWTVNATGGIGSTYEFYVQYDPITYSSLVNSSDSEKVNITIVKTLPPNVTSINLTPIYPVSADNLNCSFVLDNPNGDINLTANVTWYKNDTEYSQIVLNVTNLEQTDEILDAGNTTTGDVWSCGVKPYDEGVPGNDMNSTSRTILFSVPPTINIIQCEADNYWQDCSNITFLKSLQAVRANCTDSDNAVSNASFSLSNNEHNITYFSNTIGDNVQRGVSTLTQITSGISINPVQIDNSFILLSSQSSSSNPNVLLTIPDFNGSDQMLLSKYSSTSSNVSWEIVENSLFSVQRGISSYSTSDSSLNIDISSVNLSDSFIIVYARLDTSNKPSIAAGFWRGHFVNASRISLDRNLTGYSGEVSWQVVSVNGGTIDSGTTTMSASDSAVSASLNSSFNISSSMIIFSKDFSSSGLAYYSIDANFTNTSSINFARNNAGGNANIDWFVISHPSFNVQRGYTTVSGSSPVEQAITDVDLSHTFHKTSWISTGTGNTNANAFLTSSIMNSTDIEFQKGTGSQTQRVMWQTITIDQSLVDRSDFWEYDNSDINMTQSGTYNLSVSCTDATDVVATAYSSWMIPWGNISISLVDPLTSVNATKNQFFNFTVNVSCSGGECNSVNATLDPFVEWWNGSWIYREPLNVTEQSGSSLTDYQINTTVDTASLISSGKMQSSCQDLRFADSSGNALSYWIEEGCNTASTKVWVKVNLTASSTSTIYAYYGNPSASSLSNGSATFIQFGDFSGSSLPAGWTSTVVAAGSSTDSTGSASVSGGNLSLVNNYGNDVWHGVYEATLAYQNSVVNGDFVAVTRVNSLTNTNAWAKAGIFPQNSISGTTSNGQFNVIATPGNGLGIQWQSNTAYIAPNSYTGGTSYSFPIYLQVIKSGASLSGYYSTNEASWTQIGTTQSPTNVNSAQYVPLFITTHDGSNNPGTALFDLFYVRRHTSQEPASANFGTEEKLSKGIIPMNSGLPFYTIDKNPMDYINNSCLFDMISGDSCSINWRVNATGPAYTTWEFYAYADPLNYTSYLSSVNSTKINITTIYNIAPSVDFTVISPAYPIVTDNLTCTFSIYDPNSFDSLSANVSWYRNGTFYSSYDMPITGSVNNTATLLSGNTSLGDIWSCGVIAYDGSLHSSQSNSSNATILLSRPPSINSLDCQVNGSSWVACTSLVYGDNLTGMRTNCTSESNIVTGVNFSFYNLQDNQTFFNASAGSSSGDLWYYYHTISMNNSGNFTASSVCIDNSSFSSAYESSWFIPWGKLVVNLVEPNSDVFVQKDVFFNFTSNVTCNGGECGSINFTLDPIGSWWNSSWLYRKLITVKENNNSNLQDFQVNITVDSAALITAGKMNSDCSDMRLTDENASTLDYWIEDGCNTASTKVWVKMNLSSGVNNDLYMYYGNPSASSLSNGSATFIQFGDFSGSSLPAGWTSTVVAAGSSTDSTGSVSVSGGNMSLVNRRGNDVWQGVYEATLAYQNSVVNGDFVAVTRVNSLTNTNAWAKAGIFPQNSISGTTSNGQFNVIATPGNGLGIQWQSNTAYIAPNSYSSGGSYSFPVYLKVVRSGNTFSGYNSTNGNSWSIMGSTASPSGLGSSVYIPLFDTSHNTANNPATATFDLFYVKKYVINDPSASSAGAEQLITKSVVPVGFGSPFYTTDSNPQNASDNACLGSMVSGAACEISWQVNATGPVGGSWEFYTQATPTDYYGIVVANESSHINITIADSAQVPPIVTLVAPDNSYYTNSLPVNFTCSATDNAGLANITIYLNATGSWQENSTQTLSGLADSASFLLNLAQGNYLWNCVAYDSDGNLDWGTSNQTVTVDTQAPTINLNDPLSGSTFIQSNILFNFSVSDNLAPQLYCNISIDSVDSDINFSAINGENTTRNITGITQGIHLWNVSCIDLAGNSAVSSTWNFSISDVPPNVSLTTANLTWFNSNTVNLQFNSTDNNNVTSADLLLEGILNQTMSDPIDGSIETFIVNGVNEGIYSWTVNVSDISNLTDQASARQFYVDVTPPDVNLNLPVDSYQSNVGDINFSFTQFDNLAPNTSCSIAVNGTDMAQNISAFNSTLTSDIVPNVPDGVSVWNITCLDIAGNSNTSETRTINISAPPIVVLNFPSDGYSQSSENITFNYTVDENSGLANCSLVINGEFNQTEISPLNHQENLVQINNMASGIYNWTELCVDVNGYSSSAAVNSFTIDSQSPTVVLDYPPNGFVYNGQLIDLNWTASDDISGVLYCDVTLDGTLNATNITAANGTIANYTVNVGVDGVHYWNVSCADGAGNTNISNTWNFTTKNPPQVSLLSPDNNTILNNGSNIDFSYVASDSDGIPNASLVINGVRNQTSYSVNNYGSNSFYLNISTDGIYSWGVNATDSLGGEGYSETRLITVDSTHPVINYTSPQNGEVMAWNNVTFSFTPTDNLASILDCNVTVNDALQEQDINITNGTSHEFGMSFHDGSYNWSVICIDSADNSNPYELINFTVNAPPNVTLNSPSNNYRTTQSNFTFLYTPYDYYGFENCSLIVDGTLNQSTSYVNKNVQNNFTLENLTEGDYNWTVECFDQAPDLNSYTPTPLNFSIDVSGPLVTTISPAEAEIFNSNNITFNWTATDYFGTYINCSITVSDTPTNRFDSVSAISGSSFTKKFDALSDGNHQWNLTCVDDLGNPTTTGIYNFTINQPDLSLDSAHISFNNTNPDSGETILINANVSNIGGITANNVNVSFWDGNPATTGIYIGSVVNNITNNESVIFSIPWDITSGYHTIYVSADPQDLIGELNESNNNATKTISVLQSIINSPTNNTYYSQENTTFNVTLKDYTGGLINYSVFVDGFATGQTGQLTDSVPGIFNITFAEGTHLVKIEAIDALGRRKNSTQITIVTDLQPPVITVNTPNASWFNYSTPEINFTLTDAIANVLNYSIYVNGTIDSSGNATNGTINLINLSSKQNGSYSVIIESWDEVNHIINSTPIMLYVDTVTPYSTLNAPDDGANLTSTSVALNFTVSDNMASNINTTINLDGSTANYLVNAGTPFIYNATGISEGVHYWNLSYFDEAHNSNISETKSFNVFIPPVINLLSPQNASWTNNSTTTFTYNVSDDSGITNCSLIINGAINQTNTTVTNNALNSFTVNALNGTYAWSVECYDSTAFNAYASTETRTRYVDLDSPIPVISTINDTWFNVFNPGIDFNITDNMDSVLNYTLFSNDALNTAGTVANATPTTKNLVGLVNGTYKLDLQATDEATNTQNATPITIHIDTIKPSVALSYPPNATNFTSTAIDFNFTPTDNLAPILNCSLTIDGSSQSSINVANNTQQNITLSGISGGYHYWNVTCIDLAGNNNISETRQFYIMRPDISVNSSEIYFSNPEPIENETVNVTATIRNIGNLNTGNFIVKFLNGATQIGSDYTINLTAGEARNLSVNFTSLIGTNQINVEADTPLATNGTISEENENNNLAFRNITVGLWQFTTGSTSDRLVVTNTANGLLYDWNVNNASGSNIYVTDSDSNPNWDKLQALGRNISNQSSANDFEVLDSKINATNLVDSVNKTYTSSGAPLETQTYTVFSKQINNVPVYNSTNNSNFKTGILWDFGDGGNAFNGSQDVVFVSTIEKGQQGYNETADYEMRIPATLRDYKGPDYQSVDFYIEIK